MFLNETSNEITRLPSVKFWVAQVDLNPKDTVIWVGLGLTDSSIVS